MATGKDMAYENFIESIKEKIPQRGKLTNMLVDLLFIEREAVYRRLRGEVPFTFAEVVKIADKLDISLDAVIGKTSSKSLPFQLKLTEYYNPTEVDYQMHEEFIRTLSVARNGNYSEIGFASSVIPLHFTIKYQRIHQFYTLRWLYQFGNPGAVTPFSKIIFTDRMKGLFKSFLEEVQHIKYTYFVWDELMLLYISNDIKYFNTIKLITNEEVKLIKEDLMAFLDDLEKLAITGSFDNGNKVRIFLSSLNFETTYTYIQTSEYYLTLIKTFTLNETTSLDEEVFYKIKTWIQALIRTSTLISESDERTRIMFFDKQRDILEKNL